MIVLSKTLARSIRTDQTFGNLQLPLSVNNDTCKRKCINRDSHMRSRCIQEVNNSGNIST